jgi:thiol:disulfide interchange protein DsbC
MKMIIEERKDIAFYIKMLPLKTIHPGAYDKAKAIVCEKSLTLLEEAHQGKPLSKPTCETRAIDENIRLAEKLGISGVPTLVFPDGRLSVGYYDKQTLLNMIGH